jgi:hypothetical protein
MTAIRREFARRSSSVAPVGWARRPFGGIVSRHRHPSAVFGYVIKGRWKYDEHEWTAEAGSFVY